MSAILAKTLHTFVNCFPSTAVEQQCYFADYGYRTVKVIRLLRLKTEFPYMQTDDVINYAKLLFAHQKLIAGN